MGRPHVAHSPSSWIPINIASDIIYGNDDYTLFKQWATFSDVPGMPPDTRGRDEANTDDDTNNNPTDGGGCDGDNGLPNDEHRGHPQSSGTEPGTAPSAPSSSSTTLPNAALTQPLADPPIRHFDDDENLLAILLESAPKPIEGHASELATESSLVEIEEPSKRTGATFDYNQFLLFHDAQLI